MCVKFHQATMRGTICTVCNRSHLDKTGRETENKEGENHPKLWRLSPCSRRGDMGRGLSS